MSQKVRITGNIDLPNGNIKNEHLSSSAGITVGKNRHEYKPGTDFGLDINETPTSKEKIVFVTDNEGTIRGFHALLNETGTSTEVDFDLKKNGVSVLSSPINVTHDDSDMEVIDGIFTDSATTISFDEDDVLSIEMTVTSASGAEGPFSWLDLEEGAISI